MKLRMWSHKYCESAININMRCIEMSGDNLWNIVREQININMRCIEIITIVFLKASRLWININMRCIEIIAFYSFQSVLHYD